MLDLTTAAVAWCLLVCGGFLGIWWYYEARARSAGHRPGRRRAFHCTRCGAVYSVPGPEDPVPCPRCGRDNPRLRF